ncbi:uncharacterized protein LOC111288735 [Durio zibethinus]|uniref:Uncharacterized protein LOC111288735 n=1 Tax=Durio zibethinus TaxID=66656 RepID=A0A6P5Y649_DURZI|nr:uncharacterized protein LOC111288735 [Durio zibethinus]
MVSRKVHMWGIGDPVDKYNPFDRSYCLNCPVLAFYEDWNFPFAPKLHSVFQRNTTLDDQSRKGEPMVQMLAKRSRVLSRSHGNNGSLQLKQTVFIATGFIIANYVHEIGDMQEKMLQQGVTCR